MVKTWKPQGLPGGLSCGRLSPSDLLLKIGLSPLVHQPDVAPEVSVTGRPRAHIVQNDHATADAIAFHVDHWKKVPFHVPGVLPAGTAWVCKDQGVDRVSQVKAIPRDVLGPGRWVSALCPVHPPPLGAGVTICLLQAQQLSHWLMSVAVEVVEAKAHTGPESRGRGCGEKSRLVVAHDGRRKRFFFK